MNSKSSQTEDKTVKNTVDPMQMAQYQQNYADTVNVANSLKPYTGQITAGFNPLQTQSQGILSAIAQDPRYQTANTNAMGIVQGVADTKPQTYDASLLAGTDLSPYLNPYTDQVVNTTLADLQHAREQQGVADMQSATRAGSFQGAGTRFGVQNANTSNDYLRNVASTTAGLRSGAYSNAQQAALADVGAQNAAKQFNINSGLQFGNQRLNTAGQLANLNNNALQLATQQGGILASVGDAQQAQQQRELTDAYNAYLQGQQLTLAQRQLINQALGMIPVQTTQQTNGTTTTSSNPGIGGILGGVASLGLAAATGGSSLGLSGALGGLGGLFGATKALPSIVGSGSGFGTGYAGGGLYSGGNFIG